jgi:hypothetical protein
MRSIFKSRRPAPQPAPAKPSDEDIMVAFLNGLNLAEWNALPAIVKVDLRENVAHAPGVKL